MCIYRIVTTIPDQHEPHKTVEICITLPLGHYFYDLESLPYGLIARLNLMPLYCMRLNGGGVPIWEPGATTTHSLYRFNPHIQADFFRNQFHHVRRSSAMLENECRGFVGDSLGLFR